jgi:tyrosine-protein kinase Etk/Wzc
MTPRRSMVGIIARSHWLGEPGRRRGIFFLLVLVCAILTVFPQKHRAAVSLTPTDPASLGLSGTLGQLGAVNSVFGNQAAVDVSLKVARSIYVRQIVAKGMGLEKRFGKTPMETSRWLERHVEIRSLRGGILQFEMLDTDADFARQLVENYAEATREQLAVVARTQTAYKRKILDQLVSQSSDRLAASQSRFDSYRLQTRQGDPSVSIGETAKRVPVLEAAIKAKEVQLNATRQFATDENIRVGEIKAEISALRQQLTQARSQMPDNPNSVGQVVRQSTEYKRLERQLNIDQALYDSYSRYLQGTSVEDLTSTATVRILEPAYIDPAIQLNILPLALCMVLALLGLMVEFYTLRPPVGGQ